MATVRNRAGDQELVVTADYMIAADGANSPVRNELKAATMNVNTIANFLNIYFEANLADLVKGREFSQFLVREPGLTGFLLSIDNRSRWAFHLKFSPEKGEAPTDYPESTDWTTQSSNPHFECVALAPGGTGSKRVTFWPYFPGWRCSTYHDALRG